MKNNYSKLLHKYIPGGAHTYSKGDDQFPSNAPKILLKGKGSKVYDSAGNCFIDYGMGLRSVNIGYAEKNIINAAIKDIRKGNNLSRPTLTELSAARTLINLIKRADMVKFTKNGSSAVTAAVKLARAYTGKKKILICKQHPFFSYDDWFIGSTEITKGIPREIINLTMGFNYNKIKELKSIIKKNKNEIACLVTEAVTTECPKIKNMIGCCNKLICDRNYKKSNHFLKQVQRICNQNNIIFILDEMITGFRWDLKGAQNFFNIDPDISTFGKAMANGFSLAAVCGKKKIMKLGAINEKNKERVFLLSTTHGAEMASFGAFIESLKFMKKNNVIKKNGKYAETLIKKGNIISAKIGILDYFKFYGPVYNPNYICLNENKEQSLKYKTLFMQEMIKNGVLMPYISISYRHTEKDLKKTLSAIEKSLIVYKQAIDNGIDKYLIGSCIKPVFRKYN